MNDEVFEHRCHRIRVVITDVDGVLTDGSMYYSEKGDEIKKFNVRDGSGVALLKGAGLAVGAMTGESTELAIRRAKKMGMDFICTGVRDKIAFLKDYLAKSCYSVEEVAYIGDEINDLSLLGEVGIFFAVADASHFVCRRADKVLPVRGGEGALLAVATIILERRGTLEHALAKYQDQIRASENCGALNGFFTDLSLK